VTLGSFQVSNWLADNIINPYQGTYNFRVTATGSVNGGAGNTAQITFHFLDEDENILESGDSITIPNGAGLSDYAVSLPTSLIRPITPFYIMIQANNLTSSSNNVDVAVTYDPPVSELEISEPDGWKGARIKWTRDQSFFSLIEHYEGDANGAFIFYGRNETEGIDGGIEFIRTAEAEFGYDVDLEFLAEYSADDVTFTTLFTGQLDVSHKVEMKDNKMQVPVIRDSLWVKFLNRFDTPMDVTSNVDVDGNPVDPAIPITVQMTSQRIEKVYSGRYLYCYDVGQMEGLGYEYYQPDFELESLSEILGKITLPRLPVSEVSPIFQIEEDGLYTFDIKLTLGHNAFIDPNFCQSTLSDYVPWIQKNDDTPVAFVGTDVTHGADVVTEWVFNQTISLVHGDTIRIYVEDLYDQSTDNLYIFGDEGFEYSGAFQYGESYMEVTAQTTTPETQAQGYLIHDLIHAVTARMGLGSDPFYSEFLGSTLTNAKQYDDDGCGWMYAILKGVHIRGYSLTDEPDDPALRYSLTQKGFSISMKDIWDGINPILNLGLGYELIDDVQVIRIEPKSHFIGDTPPVNFSNVREITSRYDNDMIFKTIKTGYKTWQSEQSGGIDDPQTKHTYATRIIHAGKEINLESGFIAASLAIEITRRTKIIKSSDFRFDNDTFIIALNTNDLSPDRYAPELDENFSLVENLKNPETRYNIGLSPMHNLLRWANYLSGCLQAYLNSSFKFVSGEGNYDMTTNAILGDCERDVLTEELSESDDISLTYLKTPEFVVLSRFDYFFLPILFEIQIPMEKEDFDLLDRKQPIGISQTDEDHVNFHIKELEYDLIKGEATITAWPEEAFEITVPEVDIVIQCPEP
jgi:hypothetical protein